MFAETTYFLNGSGIDVNGLPKFSLIFGHLEYFLGLFLIHPYHQKMLLIHVQFFQYDLRH